MFGWSFFHDTIRKYVIYCGNLFNDVVIHRIDKTGNSTGIMRVPLTYASKDKMLTRVKQDPLLDKETAITLPRMSFYLTNMFFDGKRHLNPIGKNVARSNNVNKMKLQYNPVPYNFIFELYILTKNVEDGFMITEQILPFFTPEWNATLNIMPDMEHSVDVPVILKSVSHDDSFEGIPTDRRVIMWTLQFEMKAFLYGPILNKPIIKFSKTNYFFGNPEDNSDPVEIITVTPGMTANGEPTTNPEESINPYLIDIFDDWDFAIEQQRGIEVTFE